LKILDASSFIHGYNPLDNEGKHYTTENIVNEVITHEHIVNIALDSSKLIIMEPSEKSIKLVENIKNKTGDNLSNNDIEILALAIDLKGTLYTDDYGLQNVAKLCNIKTEKIIYEGIKEQISWKLVCNSCKKSYSINYSDNICEICGGTLVKKVNKNKNKRNNNKHKNKKYTKRKSNNLNNNNEIKFL